MSEQQNLNITASSGPNPPPSEDVEDKQIVEKPKQVTPPKEIEDEKDSSSDNESMKDDNDKIIPKFNLKKYERKNRKQEQYLRHLDKGRKGIANYDIFCKCFERGFQTSSNITKMKKSQISSNQEIQKKKMRKQQMKINKNINSHLISYENRQLYFQIGPDQNVKYTNEGNMSFQMNIKTQSEVKPTTLITNKPINFEEQGSIFYYEIKIAGMKNNKQNILLGFCDKDQKHDKILGFSKTSYGYQANAQKFNNVKEKAGLSVLGLSNQAIQAQGEEFGPKFECKDIIGCGLLLDKREIFYTKNGAFIGIAFKNVEIPENGFYAGVTLQSTTHQIQTNFGHQKFQFDLQGFRQREGLENFFDICQTPLDQSKMHDLVRSYLVHYSYVETLQAVQDEEQIEEIEKSSSLTNPDKNLPHIDPSDNKFPGLTQTEFPDQQPNLHKSFSLVDRKMTGDFQIQGSAEKKQVRFDEEEIEADAKRNEQRRIESKKDLPFSKLAGEQESLEIGDLGSSAGRKSSLINLGSQQSNDAPIGRLQRSESHFVPPQVSDLVIKKNEEQFKPDSSIHLKERSMLKYKIQSGKIQDAIDYMKENFKEFYEKNTKSRAYLDALKFIKYIKDENLSEAVQFSQDRLIDYINKDITIPTRDKNGNQRLIHVSQVTTLICFSQEDLLFWSQHNPNEKEDDQPMETEHQQAANDFGFLITEHQRLIIADLINNEFLRFHNGIEPNQPLYSNLEMVMKHLYLCNINKFILQNKSITKKRELMSLIKTDQEGQMPTDLTMLSGQVNSQMVGMEFRFPNY